MKVFIAGSHGVGKTTTVEQLSKKITKYKFYTNISQTFDMNKEAQVQYNSIEFYKNQKNRRDRYVQLFESNDCFIADRSLVDVLAYTIRGYNNCTDVLVKNELNHLIETLKLDIQVIGGSYYYFPITKFDNFVNNNNLRLSDDIFQSEIDQIIREVLWDLSIEYTCTPFSKDRVNNIISDLRG